jgi:hypothetical protein
LPHSLEKVPRLIVGGVDLIHPSFSPLKKSLKS